MRHWAVLAAVVGIGASGLMVACVATGAPRPVATQNTAPANSPPPLPPALLQRLRQPIPRKDWRIQAYLFADQKPFSYRVQLEKSPREHFSWTLPRSGIRLTLLDSHGHLVKDGPRLLPGPDVPGVLRPAVTSYGREELNVPLVLERGGAKAGYYSLTVSFKVNAKDDETGERVRVPVSECYQSVYLAPEPDKTPAVVGSRADVIVCAERLWSRLGSAQLDSMNRYVLLFPARRRKR